MLPSEAELCERYEVSRFTVREAIRQIQSVGLVSTRQGLGTRVEQIDEARHFSLSLKSIDEVEQHGHYTRLVDVVTRDVIADDALAGILRCQPDEQFLYMESYRVPRDSSVSVPVAWNESYIIGAYAGIRDQIGQQEGAVYSLLERQFDDRITEIQQEISAINLDEADCSTFTRAERQRRATHQKILYRTARANPFSTASTLTPATGSHFRCC